MSEPFSVQRNPINLIRENHSTENVQHEKINTRNKVELEYFFFQLYPATTSISNDTLNGLS